MSKGEQRTSNGWGSAPTTLSTSVPFLKAIKEGICPVRQKRNRESGQGDTCSPETNFLNDVRDPTDVDSAKVDGWDPFGDFFEELADHSAYSAMRGDHKVEDADLVPTDLTTG